MKYGVELIKQLEADIERIENVRKDRAERIATWETDIDDGFLSDRIEQTSLNACRSKIELLKHGGCSWFNEYATLDGTLVKAHWCNTKFGRSLRAEMPDGSVVWTTASTSKGLANKGLKKVRCLRPAWFAFHSSCTGLMGAYAGDYVEFPSDVNYATGEPAGADPIEIEEI